LIIKKRDINSIFPRTINKIINSLDDVSKSEKLTESKPKRLEFPVLVIVKIESLKEFSKLSPPVAKTLDKIKILIKKQMKIKKEEFKFSLLILFSVFKIFRSIIIFGVASLKSSIIVDLKRMYILINFIPEEFEIKDPPIIVKKTKNK
tara:strand:+ start:104 stop:547 length:444 start_codon:yes stop_codon:yes gene_type:complete